LATEKIGLNAFTSVWSLIEEKYDLIASRGHVKESKKARRGGWVTARPRGRGK